jgi:hypothetical protein
LPEEYREVLLMRAGIPLADQPNLPARKLDMILAIHSAVAEVEQGGSSGGGAATHSADGPDRVVVRTPVR